MLLEALALLDLKHLPALYRGARLTLCARASDLPIFDRCFARFFLHGESKETVVDPDPEAPPMLPGSAAARRRNTSEDQRDLDIGATSPEERLRLCNLARLNEEEKRQIYALIARMRGKVAIRRSRRFRRERTGQPDIAATFFNCLRHAGELALFFRRQRGSKPRRRVFLLDVSGSMSPYAGGLMRLAYAAHRCAPKSTEVFTIGTRLTRITSFLRTDDAEAAIVAASAAVPDWAGGTLLGDQLKAFLEIWGHRGMARGAKIVLASDGWERGDTSILAEQMQRLRRLGEQIIWVSPHASITGFEPLTRGMIAALPFVHLLVAGSTADELEKLLSLLEHD